MAAGSTPSGLMEIAEHCFRRLHRRLSKFNPFRVVGNHSAYFLIICLQHPNLQYSWLKRTIIAPGGCSSGYAGLTPSGLCMFPMLSYFAGVTRE
jgi:hypothetical protein